MRVLMLTYSLPGVSNFVRCFSLARRLAGDHKVTILAAASRPGLGTRSHREDGVRIVEAGDVLPRRARLAGVSPIEVLSRLSFLAEESFDIVHGFGHRPTASLPALAFRRRRGVPYVMDWADLWGRGGIADERGRTARLVVGGFDDLWERRILRTADALTVICAELETRARSLGVPASRVLRLPVGSNTDVIRPLPKRAMRGRVGLPADAHVAVHAGLYSYDSELLARAFVRVAARDPRALLVLVGGPQREVEGIVAAAGFAERLRPMGFVPYERLGEILACGDVMLLPYTRRGVNLARYPNKLGDYLAAGRPVVTNRTGDLGERVAEDRVGLLAEESPEDFAEKVLRLFEDTDLAEELGRRARAVAETKLSWSALAASLGRFYESLRERGATALALPRARR